MTTVSTTMRMLHGDTIPVADTKEVQSILTAFFEAFGIADAKESAVSITEDAMRFAGEYTLRAIGYSDVIGMQTIHFVFDTNDPEVPFDYEDDFGCFCYVHNLEAPHCSEYGSCGFKRRGDGIYRIW